ncbi:MAG: type IV pilus twitching motility protein PilT [Gammaproteobacteria bacterium]|nr:type IV pilus twitching motility protein PilT [Gammaproteobacteria bacterium]
MDIMELLTYTVAQNASDLHLSCGVAPLVRIDDELRQVPNSVALDEVTIREMLYSVLPPEVSAQLGSKMDLDLAISVFGLASRFRVNVFHQFRGISAAFRSIPVRIPSIAELGLPKIYYKLCDIQNGLILITGVTGSGKSTTLAALIDHINNSQNSHILTIEDPVEYLHECKKCLIQQREVGKHTASFDDALRAALREDPDYILVGEMRDLETVRLALTAAETGHLVFATLHTNSAAESIDRIVDVFPTHEKSLIRGMLANSLRAVICQVLVRKIGGGRMAAQEVMVCTPAISNMIRENKIQQLYSAIQTGQEKGMQTLSQNLQDLVAKKLIDPELYRDLMYDRL